MFEARASRFANHDQIRDTWSGYGGGYDSCEKDYYRTEFATSCDSDNVRSYAEKICKKLEKLKCKRRMEE